MHSSSKIRFCIYLRDSKQGIRIWTEDGKLLGKDLRVEKTRIYFLKSGISKEFQPNVLPEESSL